MLKTTKFDHAYAQLRRGRPQRLTAPPRLDLVCSALAHRGRRAILQFIAARGVVNLVQIGEVFPAVSRTTLDQHVLKLLEAGLVRAERHPLRSPRQPHYRIVPEAVYPLRAWLSDYMDRFAISVEAEGEVLQVGALLGQDG